jgi:hypothetical protein
MVYDKSRSGHAKTIISVAGMAFQKSRHGRLDQAML